MLDVGLMRSELRQSNRYYRNGKHTTEGKARLVAIQTIDDNQSDGLSYHIDEEASTYNLLDADGNKHAVSGMIAGKEIEGIDALYGTVRKDRRVKRELSELISSDYFITPKEEEVSEEIKPKEDKVIDDTLPVITVEDADPVVTTEPFEEGKVGDISLLGGGEPHKVNVTTPAGTTTTPAEGGGPTTTTTPVAEVVAPVVAKTIAPVPVAAQDLFKVFKDNLAAYAKSNRSGSLQTFLRKEVDGKLVFTTELPTGSAKSEILNYTGRDDEGNLLPKTAETLYMRVNKAALINQYFSDIAAYGSVLKQRFQTSENSATRKGQISASDIQDVMENMEAELVKYKDVVAKSTSASGLDIDAAAVFNDLLGIDISADALGKATGLQDTKERGSLISENRTASELNTGLTNIIYNNSGLSDEKIISHAAPEGIPSDKAGWKEYRDNAFKMSSQEIAENIDKLQGGKIDRGIGRYMLLDTLVILISQKSKTPTRDYNTYYNIDKLKTMDAGALMRLIGAKTKSSEADSRYYYDEYQKTTTSNTDGTESKKDGGMISLQDGGELDLLKEELESVKAQLQALDQAGSKASGSLEYAELEFRATEISSKISSLTPLTNANGDLIDEKGDIITEGKVTIETPQWWKGRGYKRDKSGQITTDRNIAGKAVDATSGARDIIRENVSVSDAAQLALIIRAKNRRIGTARLTKNVATPGFIPGVEGAKDLDLTDARRENARHKDTYRGSDPMLRAVTRQMDSGRAKDTASKLDAAQAAQRATESTRVFKETEMQRAAGIANSEKVGAVVNSNIDLKNKADVAALAAKKANSDEFYQNLGQWAVGIEKNKQARKADTGTEYTKLQVISDRIKSASYEVDRLTRSGATAEEVSGAASRLANLKAVSDRLVKNLS